MFDAFDTFQLFFNPDTDALFNFLGSGTKIRNADADNGNVNVRK